MNNDTAGERMGLEYDKGAVMKRKGTSKNWWLTGWQGNNREEQI